MKVKVFNSQTLIETKELDLAVATRINGECTVGRSPNSGLILDSPDVSRLHGKVTIVQDLTSIQIPESAEVFDVRTRPSFICN